MSAWPSTLPAPRFDGYEVAPVQAFERTDMESGPARQRAIFTDVPENISLTVRLTAAEMVTFRTFWLATIHNGADVFTCDKIDVGAGFATYNVRATASYRARPLPGMNWDVSFPVEVLDA